MYKFKSAKYFLVLLGAISGASFANDWNSIRIATEGAYEPWNLTLPGGKLGGFEPELMKNLCERMKADCSFSVQDWDGMIAGLNAGKYDVIMDSIVVTPERKKVISFTHSYAATPASFIVKNKSLLSAPTDSVIKIQADETDKIQSTIAPIQKALKGKVLGIQSGTVYTPFIDEYFGDTTVREYSSAAAAMLDLKSGRIDAVFDDVTFAQALLAKKENQKLSFAGPKIGGNIWGEGEAFGIRNADGDLQQKLNVALQAAIDDGTVKQLSQKWFHTDVTP